MSSNPYRAPNTAQVSCHSGQPRDGANISSLTAVSVSLVCSIPCGILAGIAWGSGVMTNRISGMAGEFLIGLCLGISLLVIRHVFPGDGLTYKWSRYAGLLLGSGISVASIHFLYAVFRAAGLHLIYSTMPWTFAVLNFLPIVVSTACVSLTIWMARLTTCRQASWLVLLSSPIVIVGWGALDDILLLPARNAGMSHYALRMILLTVWMAFTTGFVAFCRSGRHKSDCAPCVTG